MALKQLILAKKLEQKRMNLGELLEREETLKKRSEAAEAALEEAATEEEVRIVEEEAAAIDAEQDELDKEKSGLEAEIRDIEGEIDGLERNAPKSEEKQGESVAVEKRRGEFGMKRRDFFGMNQEEKRDFFQREDVKEFISRSRELGSQNRAVSGAELNVPEVMLGLLRENITAYSKLITKVNYKPVKGVARQNVNGTVPEAVWTEMAGYLNELELSFNQVEVDGYKVGGFIPIPNYLLADSDENLGAEIIDMLGKAIGMALDKAIIYGKGTKQPLGIATRLAQTAKPSTYPDVAPTWVDLHTTHITKTAATGSALIGAIITAFGVAKSTYSDGRKIWVMNNITKAKLVTSLLNFNAAGAIVTGMNGEMPILGGEIIDLDFIPDNDIIGGYGDMYLLAEREGATLGQSEHVMFIEDMTVFKGIARYDGMPVIADSFVIININNSSATTAKDFEVDYANTELGALGITSVAGTASGDTLVTITGGEVSGTTFGYKVGGKTATVKSGATSNGYTTIESGDDITAVTGTVITVVEFDAAGRAIKVGSAQVVSKA